MNNFSGELEQILNKVKSKCSLGSPLVSTHSLWMKSVSPPSLLFSPSPLISLICPCSHPPHPHFLLCFLYLFSPLFAPVWFAPKASGWDIVTGVMVCDLSFLHSYSSLLILLSTEWLTVSRRVCREWVSVRECVYFCLIILYDLLHLFGCRCLGTHPPLPRVWVSWISWVTPSLKSITKSQRYAVYSHKHTNMPMSC